MIVGVGVDIVDIARFDRAATRTPALLERLFSETERVQTGRTLSSASLAGRFAAKEALIKAFGHSTGVRWHDLEVISDSHGNPAFQLHNAAAALATGQGINAIHLSMSHDAGIAIAYVITEGMQQGG